MPDKKRTAAPDWEDLKFMLELARAGSLSAAARVLGVTHATVSRRIASLEAELNVQLFDRSSGNYMPTRAGEQAIRAARAMEEQATEIERLSASAAEGLSGSIRITATEVFASYFLISRMRPLMRSNPELHIELMIDSSNLSLARRRADIAIRHGRPEGANLVTRKVADYSNHFYADRDYLERLAGRPMQFLGYMDESAQLPEARYLETVVDPATCVMNCNSLPARLAATRAGIGVGIIPKFVALQYPQLKQVDVGGMQPLVRELWIVAHPDVRAVPRFRMCFDHLVETIAAARPMLN